MKTLYIITAIILGSFTVNFSSAQSSLKKDTLKIWGNCGSCKKNIEKAAKSAGASYANWNEDTKMLNVRYNTATASNEKIQKAIAAAGYDTQDFTADNKAYNKLAPCCQYDRKP